MLYSPPDTATAHTSFILHTMHYCCLAYGEKTEDFGVALILQTWIWKAPGSNLVRITHFLKVYLGLPIRFRSTQQYSQSRRAWRFGIRNNGRGIFFSKTVQPDSGAHPAFYSTCTEGVFFLPGVKRSGHEDDHWTKSSAELGTSPTCSYGVDTEKCEFNNPLNIWIILKIIEWMWTGNNLIQDMD
jgi:hypothetical protein